MILNFLKGFNIVGKRKPTNFEQKIKDGIKIHTIREDLHNRWSEGMKIHFSTGSRTSQYNCFKEGKCKSIQFIEIFGRTVIIDVTRLSYDEIEMLAENDGFDSIDDFWAWFDQYTPFVGRLIHWTDYKY